MIVFNEQPGWKLDAPNYKPQLTIDYDKNGILSVGKCDERIECEDHQFNQLNLTDVEIPRVIGAMIEESPLDREAILSLMEKLRLKQRNAPAAKPPPKKLEALAPKLNKPTKN